MLDTADERSTLVYERHGKSEQARSDHDSPYAHTSCSDDEDDVVLTSTTLRLRLQID